MDHTDIVRDLTFAPDGSLVLVSASRDKTLRVWDLKDDGEDQILILYLVPLPFCFFKLCILILTCQSQILCNPKLKRLWSRHFLHSSLFCFLQPIYFHFISMEFSTHSHSEIWALGGVKQLENNWMPSPKECLLIFSLFLVRSLDKLAVLIRSHESYLYAGNLKIKWSSLYLQTIFFFTNHERMLVRVQLNFPQSQKQTLLEREKEFSYWLKYIYFIVLRHQHCFQRMNIVLGKVCIMFIVNCNIILL